eukprot:TRINITY_DN17186_c0_g1_i1.p1 TRINITY_DN17186_c0_g1~~TRINITY_DN17186_c0_g1_i1.p1  ORF type:complete len:343 (-),score=71.66 TRINITY_DN17186_c0_g1_i1:32-973(-)
MNEDQYLLNNNAHAAVSVSAVSVNNDKNDNTSGNGGVLLSNRDAYSRFRRWMWMAVEGPLDSPTEYALLVLILLNVLAFMIGTVDVGHGIPCTSDCEKLDTKYNSFFEGFELFSVIIFTLEYLMRVWSCMEEEEYRKLGPVVGRLRYMFTFFLVVDVLSIVPFYISLAFDLDIDFTTALRGFRLIRLLKAEQYLQAFSLLGNVIKSNATLLIAASFYALLCLVTFATLLYYTERNSGLEAAPFFQSIPQALFPVCLMLTGEFPLSDFTPLGQFFACLLAVFAVAIFAVPTAVLGSGFVKALQDSQHRQFTVDA